jgi:hypothetical protein
LTPPARSAVALALVAGYVAACAERVPPPAGPPPLDVERPGAAIPGDLDVAVRFDLANARRLFGPDVASAIALDITDPDDHGTADLVHGALVRADTAWIAFRPGLAPSSTDNVLLLRGDFGDLDPHGEGEGWEAPSDLGGAMRVYRRPAPKRRSSPARIYARADDWLVFVSTAEVDAAERSIERRAADEHVDPPDHGLVSLAARTEPLVPLLAKSYPAFAEALEGASLLDGSATADDRGLGAELAARFTTGTDAERARDRMKLLQSVLSHAKGPFALLAQGATVSAVGTNLVVRIRLDPAGLSSILGCVKGQGAC